MRWQRKQPIIEYNETDDLLMKLFKINGITKPKEFFQPTIEALYDPSLLGNIDNVTDKIIAVIKSGGLIGISFDADFDGISSGAIMFRYLSNFTDKLYYLFPTNREHGIEYQVDMIQPNTDLLIIVDSSTNSVEACQQIKSQGIDIVILDHHSSEAENPYATIVNPYLCDYPNKEICGAAVVWKAINVMDKKLNTNHSDNYIDLVACALIADVMDLKTLENRYIIYEGLKRLKNKGLMPINLGLKSILKTINPSEINSQTIGYGISPFINGAIRLNETEKAIKLLLSDDDSECLALASELKTMNEKRKHVEEVIYRETIEAVEDQIDHNDKIIIVPYSEDISKNYNGLIAAKISNNYQRPAIFGTVEDDYFKGSFRSYGDFNVRDFLKEFPDLIDYSMGHPQAGGCGFKMYKLDKIKDLINTGLDEENFIPVMEYDTDLNAEEITEKLIQRINTYDYVTGKGFPAAKFLVKNLFVTDKQVIGKNSDTVKFTCTTENDDELVLIKFKTNEDWKGEIGILSEVEVVGQLNLNKFFNWGKKQTVTTKQLIIDDIRTK